MAIQTVIVSNGWDFSSDTVTCMNRNGPLRKTKSLGTYEMPVRLQQTFLLQSFVLHASNKMGVKCALVILLVFFWQLVSAAGAKCVLRGMITISEN